MVDCFSIILFLLNLSYIIQGVKSGLSIRRFLSKIIENQLLRKFMASISGLNGERYEPLITFAERYYHVKNGSHVNISDSE